MGKLENLVELDVEDNLLDMLPDSLQKIKALKTLYIDNNSDIKKPKGLELDFCDVD